MFYELAKSDYEKAQPIFNAMNYNLAPISVIKGRLPGKIYVDDPLLPGAALTWVKHRFYLAGDPGNKAFDLALQNFFATEVFGQSPASGDYGMVLYYAPDEWQDRIEIILEDKFPIKSQRQYYAGGKLEKEWREFIPKGYSLRPIDAKLLAQTHLKNYESMIAEIHSERYSLQQYLRQDFGFCVLQGDEIAGLCFSEHTTGRRCEVGVQTFREHRRQGLATAMSLALIEHALSRGITRVGWHCYARNKGSIATAQKAGFEKMRDYPACYICFKKADNLAEHGYKHFHQGEYHQAINCWQEAFETGDAPAWAYYMAARAWAACKDRERAFQHLCKAIGKGWRNIDSIKSTQEFSAWLGTPEWKKVLAQFE